MTILRRIWKVICRTGSIFIEIDGEQRAASFAFYAFFSLFPLILLFVSIGSVFTDPHRVTAGIVDYVSIFAPLNDQDKVAVLNEVVRIIDARHKLGLLAVVVLFWTSTHFFHAMVRGVNRAWHTVELGWWRLPLRKLTMVGIMASALLVGMLAPVILNLVETAAQLDVEFLPVVFRVIRLLVPPLVLFYGFAMLYKVSPRRKTTFQEVWFPAVAVTGGLIVLQKVFLFFVYKVGKFNLIYGTFGIFVVLLLWIYLCGVAIIAGACLCASQNEVFGRKNRSPG